VVTLNSTTRLSRVEVEQVTSPPRDNWCLANGKKPINWTQKYDGTTLTSDMSGFMDCPPAGYNPVSKNFDPAPGFFQFSENRPGTARNSTNTLLANDSSLKWSFNTLGLEHDLITGITYSKEKYERDSGRMVFNPDGTLPNAGATPTAPISRPININNPDSHFYGPINYFATDDVKGELETRSAYFFDTIKLNQYFQVLAGLRYDSTDGSFVNDKIDPATGVRTAGVKFESNDDLISYKLGAIIKPVENASLYVSYANSETPSQTSVNGGCSAANCNVDPEKAETYEAGIKWDFMDNKLSSTASLFRTERTNYKVGVSDESGAPQVLDGSSRVQGLELGLSGLLLPNWSIFANATIQDSEVLQGSSDQISAAGRDWTKGDPILFVPKVAGSLWTTYEFFNLPFYGRSVQLGYGLTYQGKTTLSQHTGIENSNTKGDFVRSTLPLVESDDYVVQNLMVRYMANKNVTVQLNVRNLFDEEYYTNIRSHSTNGTSGSWAYPGEGRSAVLNLTYKF
jgi:catecholate siderophore receptor